MQAPLIEDRIQLHCQKQNQKRLLLRYKIIIIIVLVKDFLAMRIRRDNKIVRIVLRKFTKM